MSEKDKLNLDVWLYGLYNITVCEVSKVRERARSGRKDEARDWLRYFTNARILEILSLYTGVFPVDLFGLRSDLSLLNSEVHPLEPCDNKTDLEKIRERLDELVANLPPQKTGKSSGPRFYSDRKTPTLSFKEDR